jgi:hypothetical protein
VHAALAMRSWPSLLPGMELGLGLGFGLGFGLGLGFTGRLAGDPLPQTETINVTQNVEIPPAHE